MPRFSPWSAERALAVIAEYRDVPGALLPALHALMAEFGHIEAAAIPLLAEAMRLSRADVQGVISFYHDFRTEAPGRHVIRLCRAEACQSMGSASLEAHAKRRLAIDWGETSADGAVTLEAVFCLGNCALSPALMVDEDLYGRVDPGRFDAIVTALRQPATSVEPTS